MIRSDGLRQAAQALYYWERRQEVVAHNLANVSTPGFKGERVFARMLAGQDPVADAVTNLEPGTLSVTDRPLDLALEGPGFFVVQTPDGERLTRGGALRLDEAGQLVDAAGNPVLGEEGPIVVPDGTIEIDRAGVVRVDGARIARLRVETVPEGTRLVHDAGTYFLPDAGRAPMDPADRQVRQGVLEESNVDPVGSLVEMITIQRAYTSVQRSIRVVDGVMDIIANRIGQVG